MKKIWIVNYENTSKNYVDAFFRSGALPYVSPFEEDIEQFDAMVLPGGGDIHPSFYGQTNLACKNINYELDLLQFYALQSFLKTKKPILGICKGMQIINVFFGGSLYQNSKTAPKHKRKHGDLTHITHATTNSFLETIYGSNFSVNSAHHQSLHMVGDGFIPIQTTTNDHTIEGIQHETLPIYGIQWHPERMAYLHCREDTVDGSKLFRFFLNE